MRRPDGVLPITASALAMSLWAFITPASAEPVEDFYKGKSVNLIISTGAGGGLDIGARLVGRHMENHIPGNPSIVARNMPGAGHVQATNYMYNQASRDGANIASILPAFVLHQVIDGRGVKYDAAQFNWLGSSDVDNMNLYVWHTANVKSIEDAKTREVLMGATGAGSYTALFPTLLNNLLGTKFKIVSGYRTTVEVHLAMERGEVQGRAGNFFTTLKSNNAEWLNDKKIAVLMQVGVERDPEFKDVPLMTDLTGDPAIKRILALFSGEIAMGRAMLTTPGVPEDRLAALRKAFEDTLRDPAYIEEAAKIDLPVRGLGHARVAEIAREILTTPPDLIARAKQAKFGEGTSQP